MLKSLLRMFRKSKPQPRRNTPWLGWRPGQAPAAFERGFTKRERKPLKPEPTRSVLWTIQGRRRDYALVLEMAI